MKKEDVVGCLQFILLIVTIGIISYFMVKIIPQTPKSQEYICREKNGVPIFKEEIKYRGFPPGSWNEMVFYKCE